MKEESFAIHITPWLHIVTEDGGVCLHELLPESGRVYVARVAGQDMSDEVSAFQQLYEKLKFPDYFGWNWNALYDCLRDLQWLPSDHHILIIESAESVLSEDETAREMFFRTLWRAGRQWSYVKRPEGVTLSRLSVVLLCDEGAMSDVADLMLEFEDHPGL
ncbi:barstar family protein [Streptomyces sp. NPDC046237]|uniref:barstar family protein n=1 Tax=Streptomyces sp. NPDC046237 TaxID=3154914 RepID=UPI0034056635